MKSRPLHTLVAVTATLVMIAAVFAVRTAPAPRSWGNRVALDRDRQGPVVEAGGRSVSDDESSPGTKARPGHNDIGDAHTLVGRFALADGTPVQRAELSVDAMHAGRNSANPKITTSWSCETDRQGQFRLAGLPAGWFRGIAKADGVPFGRFEFELPREARLVILTRPLRRFRVTVADDEGAPIAGARVSALPFDTSGLTRSYTDRDGIADLLVEVTTKLGVNVSARSDDDRAPYVSPESVYVPADTRSVAFVVPRGARVSGRLLDGSGAPIADGRVTVIQAGVREESSASDREGRFDVVVARELPVTLEFDGSIDEREFGRRSLPVHARLDGVHPGSTDLELRCDHGPGALVVRVVDPDGHAVGRAAFDLFELNHGGPFVQRSLRTGRDGVAMIDNLPQGDHVLVASAIWRKAWAAPEAATVQADGRIVTLSYRKGRRIVGEVTDAGGLRASSGLEVEARIDGERVGSDSVSRGGTFRLLVPADDERTVELTVAGRELMSGPVRDDPKSAGWRRLRLKGR